MKPISERSHDERLAAAYWWRRIGRGLGWAALIPVLLLFMSLRAAGLALVPCGTAFIVLSRMAWRRWKTEGFYDLSSIKHDDQRSDS